MAGKDDPPEAGEATVRAEQGPRTAHEVQPPGLAMAEEH